MIGRLGPAAAGGDDGAVLDPGTQVALDAVALAFGDEGTDGGRLLGRVAHGHRLDAGHEGRDDLVRTPPKVTGAGDHGPSLRTVLTRKTPGQSTDQ